MNDLQVELKAEADIPSGYVSAPSTQIQFPLPSAALFIRFATSFDPLLVHNSLHRSSKAANQNFWIISLIKLFLIRLKFFKNIFRGNCWLVIFLRKKCRNRTQCR